MKIITINEIDAKKRLDVFLSEKTDLSRSQIKNFIQDEKILVNSIKVKAGYSLKINDNVEILSLQAPVMEVKAQDIKINVVYEDDDLAVIDKAQGMVVHPAVGNYENTLVNALMFKFKALSSSQDVRPGIVHRLDKNTSGLMLIAKNNNAHNFLAQQIKDKVCKREYIALVSGNLKDDEGIVSTGIGRDAKNFKKMAVYPLGEKKKAVTHYKVLKRFEGYCLVNFILETGRTHQIRVHASYLKHPIIGDEVYGGNTKLYSSGQLLHSQKISFYDLKNKLLTFESPLPDYFEKVIAKVNKIY